MTSLREYAYFMGLDSLLPKFKLPSPPQSEAHPLPNLERDLNAMLAAADGNPKSQCLVSLLGHEGLRLSEALDLAPSDINVAEGSISVWGKGGKQRVIPITQKASAYLYPQYVLALTGGLDRIVPYSDRGARSCITALGDKAKISRPVASHDLRMTFATLAYRHTADIRAVQVWLGHANVTTTEAYIKVTLADMRAAGEF